MIHRPTWIALAIAIPSAVLVACAPAVPTPPSATQSAPVSAPAASPAPSIAVSPAPTVAAAKPAASPSAAIAPGPSPARVAASPSSVASPAAGAAPAGAAAAPAGPAPPGDAAHGQQVFLTEGCYACHGTVGQGASTGPKLAPGPIPFAAFQQQVRQPRQDMPRFTPQVLNDQDLSDAYAYLQSLQPGPAATSIPLLNR